MFNRIADVFVKPQLKYSIIMAHLFDGGPLCKAVFINEVWTTRYNREARKKSKCFYHFKVILLYPLGEQTCPCDWKSEADLNFVSYKRIMASWRNPGLHDFKFITRDFQANSKFSSIGHKTPTLVLRMTNPTLFTQ